MFLTLMEVGSSLVTGSQLKSRADELIRFYDVEANMIRECLWGDRQGFAGYGNLKTTLPSAGLGK